MRWYFGPMSSPVRRAYDRPMVLVWGILFLGTVLTLLAVYAHTGMGTFEFYALLVAGAVNLFGGAVVAVLAVGDRQLDPTGYWDDEIDRPADPSIHLGR